MKDKIIQKHRKRYHKFYPLAIFLAILFMSVGYAIINSVILKVDGGIIAKAQTGVYITETKLLTNVDADINNSQVINAYQTMINSKMVLSKSNGSSSITYQITLYNKSNKKSFYLGHNYDPSLYDNTDILYEISGISIGDYIDANSSKTITIKYYYKNNTVSSKSNVLNSYINLNFEEYNLSFYNLETQLVSTQNTKLNMIVKNSGGHNVTGVITCNGTTLTSSITINKGENYKIITIDTSSILSSLTTETLYILKFQVTSPYSYTDEQIGVFKKELSPVNITKIETYINGTLQSNPSTIYNTENTILVENLQTNSTYQYRITVRNNSVSDSYKFRNVTEILNNNPNITYSLDIDLADGIVINPQKEYTFTINYNYSTSSNKHIQMLLLDFKWNYKFEAIEDKIISLGTPENSTSNKYGDFVILDPNMKLDAYCTIANCYYDNNSLIEYNEEGGMVLDSNNQILSLEIDQSMSINDEYTMYITFKADSNQIGVPSKNYPATAVAVSSADMKYLNWTGFMYNYLNIYSYYNGASKPNINYELETTGFKSINFSEFSNQKINMIITAVRGGKTNIYINGSLYTSFNSGLDPVEYTSATIGDLRPGRGLKFTGVIYDFAMYNKALTETEVQTNWEYADARWQITS